MLLQPSKTEDEGIGVGIDLGTTNSAIAYLHNGVPTIIPIPHNGRTMPSIVTLLQTTANTLVPVVGKEALRFLEKEEDSNHKDIPVYRNVKRIIGTGGKLSADIRSAVPFVIPSSTGKTFKTFNLPNQLDDSIHHPTLLRKKLIVPTTNHASLIDPSLCIPTDDSSYDLRPEVISTCILMKLKQAAEQATQRRVTRAVIGIPAYFHDGQRNATILAARNAGFDKVQLLREPEAAALAYGKQSLPKEDEEELVLVFDLGGGTYDVSVLSVDGALTEVLCTAGNAQLGGSVWDAKIAQSLHQQYNRLAPSSSKWEELQYGFLLCAEAMRIHLSNHRAVQAAFPLQDWSAVRKDPSSVILRHVEKDALAAIVNETHVILQLTRREMDQLCSEELQAILRPLREVAIMAGALLPGDSSPTLVAAAMDERSMSMEEFPEFYQNTPEDDDIGSDMLSTLLRMKESKKSQQRGRKRARDVAKEERKYRQEKSLATVPLSVTSGSTTPKVRDGISGRPISRIVLVGGATRMSCIGRMLTAVTGVTPQKTVNPDEAVALGCAVQVGRLDGVEGMGTVLTPMQAAILRAMAESNSDFEEDEDDAFDAVEVY